MPEDPRSARYLEALPLLVKIFSLVAKHPCTLAISDIREIDEACRSISDYLANAFSLICGKKCSACIKTMVDTGIGASRFRVATVSRDQASVERELGTSPLEAWIADLLEPNQICHWIELNTAFKKSYEHPGSRERCFFSNDLPGEQSYENTSFQLYGGKPDSTDPEVRNALWPLPYKSTIVAPIGHFNHVGQSYFVVGFLAVDCRSRHVFDREHDVDLILSIADSLYNMMLRYQQLVYKHVTGVDPDEGASDNEEGEEDES